MFDYVYFQDMVTFSTIRYVQTRHLRVSIMATINVQAFIAIQEFTKTFLPIPFPSVGLKTSRTHQIVTK